MQILRLEPLTNTSLVCYTQSNSSGCWHCDTCKWRNEYNTLVLEFQTFLRKHNMHNSSTGQNWVTDLPRYPLNPLNPLDVNSEYWIREYSLQTLFSISSVSHLILLHTKESFVVGPHRKTLNEHGLTSNHVSTQREGHLLAFYHFGALVVGWWETCSANAAASGRHEVQQLTCFNTSRKWKLWWNNTIEPLGQLTSPKNTLLQ